MTPSAAWRLLGLDPTGDRRAVKRAYAAKLKAIDPDKDIGGFLRLRDALETAQRAADRIGDAPFGDEAEAHLQPVRAEVQHPVVAEIDPPTSLHAGEDSFAQPTHIEEPASPAPDIRDDIAAMLAGYASTSPEPERLIGAMRQLLADERMERVEFSSETEDWLAFLLTRTIPRSDPVIPMVADHFRWMAELGKANRRPMVASAAQRAVDLECIASLEEPQHRWHAAFAKLQEPGPTALSFRTKFQLKREIADLLASLRYHNPMVERLFDPAHVALWDEAFAKSPVLHRPRKAGISWYGWLAIGWSALTIVRFVLTAMG